VYPSGIGALTLGRKKEKKRKKKKKKKTRYFFQGLDLVEKFLSILFHYLIIHIFIFFGLYVCVFSFGTNRT
jgi:hypothetical protein